VSALWRKLGGVAEAARLLEGRRGCGYRLYLEGGREAGDVRYGVRAAITA